ncbi:hypothetical protein [Capnocytophaga sp.]|uniref:hypothetical protein n=1 Tax=Capnocytophaga sp. TaxID=44737 RepID=UPI0026DAC4B9|nr:hypothetical protein [Capnocytophaga sp.]MDO5106257.1 hypothetical protein [Capnocytophaga sp.]
MKLTKKEKTIGMVLAFLLLLLTLSGSWYFFTELKVSLLQWAMFNACSPSSLVYLFGFVWFMWKKEVIFLPLALLPMYYFGTMGMFTFGWSGANIFAQMSHITMTLNLVWVIYLFVKNAHYEDFAKGLLWSILLFVPYIAYVMYYCRIHAEEVTKLLQMNG